MSNNDTAGPQYVEVPLVVYIKGERHVVGTATVNGNVVSTVLDAPIAQEVMDMLAGEPDKAHFSLGFHDWTSRMDFENETDSVIRVLPKPLIPVEEFPGQLQFEIPGDEDGR